MKKGCLGIGTFGLVSIGAIVIALIWGVSKYNGLVKENNNALQKWANIETVYQKRANLIPNLEKTVKSYAKFEKETLTAVIEARSKATSTTIDPTNMTEVDMQKYQAAQSQLSSALGRLMVVVEKYPDLKANEQYTTFQREYIAIENSIRMETVNYNKAVKEFNDKAEVFPTTMIAGMFSKFKLKPTFKSDAGSEKAPTVFSEE